MKLADVSAFAAPIRAQRQQDATNSLNAMMQKRDQYSALARHGGPTVDAANEVNWLRYTNQGAVRSHPISAELQKAFSFLPGMGVTMEVFSGGQDAEGPNRVGSHRHDNGGSGDVFFYKDGRRLDWSNPEDVPIFQEIVRSARANGVSGFGAGDGYMQPGSMHVGFGNEAVWGAGGKGENAAPWLRTAFEGQQMQGASLIDFINNL